MRGGRGGLSVRLGRWYYAGTEEVRVVSEVSWQELTKSECFGLLAGQHLGRVVLVDDRGPIALPVNFVLDRHTVLFRTDEGTKLDVAGRGGSVAFEVDGADEATRTGWSVLVRGEATEITDPDDLARVRQLPLSPWAPGAKTRYVRILPSSLTGRRIAVPRDTPWQWWG
jgi:nitroimidazol reductase NimA-like FMN-containing flavoprotein (pyridoxamine 5'-phosphate oxidase superfamily)